MNLRCSVMTDADHQVFPPCGLQHCLFMMNTLNRGFSQEYAAISPEQSTTSTTGSPAEACWHCYLDRSLCPHLEPRSEWFEKSCSVCSLRSLLCLLSPEHRSSLLTSMGLRVEGCRGCGLVLVQSFQTSCLQHGSLELLSARDGAKQSTSSPPNGHSYPSRG